MKNEFTGTWIPAHLYEDKRLKAIHRELLGTVLALHKNGCTIYNSTLAERFNLSISRIKTRLQELEKLKYIIRDNEKEAVNHKRRTIRPTKKAILGVGQKRATPQVRNGPPVGSEMGHKEYNKRKERKNINKESVFLDFDSIDKTQIQAAMVQLKKSEWFETLKKDYNEINAKQMNGILSAYVRRYKSSGFKFKLSGTASVQRGITDAIEKYIEKQARKATARTNSNQSATGPAAIAGRIN